MNQWQNIIMQLASAGKILAEWHLDSGVTFFMYIPTNIDINLETINADSDVKFIEIAFLIIPHSLKIGKHTVKNDLDTCKRLLALTAGVDVLDSTDGIRIMQSKNIKSIDV